MNRMSSSANLAAVVAFLIGFVEFGVVSGGLAWAIEDGLGASRGGHLAVEAVIGVTTLAFAVYAARRTKRFQTAQATPDEESL